MSDPQTRHPRKMSATPHEKIWGTHETEPWHNNPHGHNIGEVWFAASDAVPLLVKFLFTSDNLSVQVHPADDYALTHHQSRGKTEMWHILRTDPDAKIALGLRRRLTADQLRQASLSGEIMDLLNWVPVKPGDTFFIPAGTIHAIGAGIALCEVQQHSDITYRLYDYGRPRELHLDHGVAVSHLHRQESGTLALPVESAYFHTRHLHVHGAKKITPHARNTLYIALSGKGAFAGQQFSAGDAWEVEAHSQPFEIASDDATFLVTSEPAIAP